MKRRFLSLALALLCALTPLSAQATELQEPAEYYITLNHVGDRGTCLYRDLAHGSGMISDYFRYGELVSFPITPSVGWSVDTVAVTDTSTGSEVPSTFENSTVTFTVTTDCTVTISYRSQTAINPDVVRPGIEILRTAPSILSHPQSVVAVVGDDVTLSVSAATTPASGKLSYQWYATSPKTIGKARDVALKDTKGKVTGSQTSNLTLLGLPESLDGNGYYCVVSNDVSSVNSSVASITIAKAPVITRQPADTTAANGGECAFLVVAEGTGPMTYQWYVKNPDAIGRKDMYVALKDIKGKISGSQTNDLYLQNLTGEMDGAEIYCVVANMAGSATTRTATLNVELQAPQTPVVAISPQAITVAWGSDDVTLTANASVSDDGTLSYQWYYGHADEIGQAMSGETGQELVITPKGSEMNHYYWCVVTNTKNGQTATAQARCVFTIGGDMPEFNASSWARDELKTAYNIGLIPNDLLDADLKKPITRGEFAAVSVKVYEALSGTTALPVANSPFTDTNDAEVLKAYNVGLTNGTGDGTVYEPDAVLNREQMSTMLTRVFKRVSLPGWTLATDSQFSLTYTKPADFADDADISVWAKDSVYFMAANGIVSGVGNNTFAPRAVTAEQQATGYAQATREQALLIAVRMVENLGQ